MVFLWLFYVFLWLWNDPSRIIPVSCGSKVSHPMEPNGTIQAGKDALTSDSMPVVKAQHDRFGVYIYISNLSIHLSNLSRKKPNMNDEICQKDGCCQ